MKKNLLVLILIGMGLLLFNSCSSDFTPEVENDNLNELQHLTSTKSNELNYDWEGLEEYTKDKMEIYKSKLLEKRNISFKKMKGDIDYEQGISYIRPNNSHFIIYPIISKSGKIKEMLVSFETEKGKIISFIANKQNLESTRINLQNELKYNFNLILDYYSTKKEKSSKDLKNFDLPAGCYMTIECEACDLGWGLKEVSQDFCASGAGASPNDPYGGDTYYPGANSGGGGSGINNGGGDFSIDENIIDIDMETEFDVYKLFDNINLTYSDFLEKVGSGCYSVQNFNGNISVSLNYACASEMLLIGASEILCDDSQIDLNPFYLDRLKLAIEEFKKAQYYWFAEMLEDMIEDQTFQTVGDLVDTWKMAKEFANEINNGSRCARSQEAAQWMMAIFSPSNVGIVLGYVNFAPGMSPTYRARFAQLFSSRAKALCSDLSKGFSTFNAFKSTYGNAGSNKAWHHIVEQNQISNSGFNPQMIHHPDNLIKIESGFSGAWHNKITGAYAQLGRYPEYQGLSLRNWLVGKPFEIQYEWGLRVMREVQ